MSSEHHHKVDLFRAPPWLQWSKTHSAPTVKRNKSSIPSQSQAREFNGFSNDTRTPRAMQWCAMTPTARHKALACCTRSRSTPVNVERPCGSVGDRNGDLFTMLRSLRNGLVPRGRAGAAWRSQMHEFQVVCLQGNDIQQCLNISGLSEIKAVWQI